MSFQLHGPHEQKISHGKLYSLMELHLPTIIHENFNRWSNFGMIAWLTYLFLPGLAVLTTACQSGTHCIGAQDECSVLLNPIHLGKVSFNVMWWEWSNTWCGDDGGEGLFKKVRGNGVGQLWQKDCWSSFVDVEEVLFNWEICIPQFWFLHFKGNY